MTKWLKELSHGILSYFGVQNYRYIEENLKIFTTIEKTLKR